MSKLVVFFEGPDGAGKSTLLQSLYAMYSQNDRQFNRVEKYIRKPDLICDKKQYHRTVRDDMQAWQASEAKIILSDRSFISEYVYSPIKNKPSRVSIADIVGFLIDLRLCDIYVVIVWCYQDNIETLIHNITTRGDDYITPGELEGVVSNYTDIEIMLNNHYDVVDRCKTLHLTYNYLRDSVPALQNAINGWQQLLYYQTGQTLLFETKY